MNIDSIQNQEKNNCLQNIQFFSIKFGVFIYMINLEVKKFMEEMWVWPLKKELNQIY